MALTVPSFRQSGDSRSTVAASAAINTTSTYVAPATFVIPPNSLQVGDRFRITAVGTATSTIANVSTFVPRIGSLGTIADTSLGSFTCTGATSGTNVAFIAQFEIVVRAIGASGSLYTTWNLRNNGTTGISNSAQVVAVGSAVTVNTTGQLILGLSYSAAAATTTATFQVVTVEKV